MKTLIGKYLIIACIHCLTAVLLYRGRIVSHFRLCDSDFLVTVIPACFAFAAYCISFWSSSILQSNIGVRIVVMLGLAFLAVSLSFFLFMLIAFNLYGT